MSSPMIWIAAPGVIGGLLFLLRKSERLVIFIGVFTSLWLAFTASVMAINEVVTIGGLSFKISETLFVMGREFTLTDTQRPFLMLMYLIHAVWILGAYFSRPGEAFVPFTFGMVAILIAALAIEPFLYAALFIEIIVLMAIPLLSPPDRRPGRGVYRFLAFHSFGMPFILFTGWMLAGLEASPGDLALVVRAGALLGIGFAFLAAIFPFHSWIPMLAEDAHPYIVAFILFMLPGMVTLFGLGFLDRFVWLRESEQVFQMLRTIGVVMVMAGGLWAAFETHLGRMLGQAAIAEMGLTLLAVGLESTEGLRIYFWLILPRVISFVLWSGVLSDLWNSTGGDLRMETFRGLWKERLHLVLVLLGAHFSLVGIPLLGGFPARLALWQQLGAGYPLIAGGAVLGAVGLLAGGLRTMNIFFVAKDPENHPDPENRVITQKPLPVIAPEKRFAWGMSVLAMGAIVAAGLFPGKYMLWIEGLMAMFEQLGG